MMMMKCIAADKALFWHVIVRSIAAATTRDQRLIKQLLDFLQVSAFRLRQTQCKHYQSDERKAAVQPEGTWAQHTPQSGFTAAPHC